jgi:hypothetical protein
MRALEFFHAWDRLEAQHPFGVTHFATLFSECGVGAADCIKVDRFLLLDLMTARRTWIRRIKVECRRTERVFWAYVDLAACTVGFQNGPMHPFVLTVLVPPTPAAIVAAMVAYYELTSGCGPKARAIVRPPRAQ